MFCNNPSPVRLARCVRQKDEIATKDGLALTPNQIELMTAKGIPISTSNYQSQYIDGDKSVDFTVPVDRQRGVDIADVWNASIDAKKHLSRKNLRHVDPNPVKS